MPTVVVHGSADRTVAVANGERVTCHRLPAT
jgi:hypothetical protein